MNIIDLDDEQSGVQVYSCGINVIRDLASYVADPQWGDLTDSNTGRDITLERKGKGRDSRFTVKPAPQTSAIEQKYLDDLIALDKLVHPAENGAMQEALNKFGAALMGKLTSTASSPQVPPETSMRLPPSPSPQVEEDVPMNPGTPSEKSPPPPQVDSTSSAEDIEAKLNAILE
jgi:hypothetical protein